MKNLSKNFNKNLFNVNRRIDVHQEIRYWLWILIFIKRKKFPIDFNHSPNIIYVIPIHASIMEYACRMMRLVIRVNAPQTITAITVDHVNQLPCQNGGTCVTGDAGSYTCDCQSGYYGSTCGYCKFLFWIKKFCDFSIWL